jgi:hypothetical protein
MSRIYFNFINILFFIMKVCKNRLLIECIKDVNSILDLYYVIVGISVDIV